VQVLHRPQRAQVENGAEVDIEAFLALAGEDLHAAAQVLDGRLRQGRVVRRRARADAYRRAGLVDRDVRDLVAVLRAVDAAHGVLLLHVPVLVVQGRDWARVVEEGLGVADERAERELVDHVLHAVAVVIDVDLVEHVIAEVPEVGATGRVFQRDVVGDDGYGVGRVRANERVEVCVVGDGVVTDLGSFTMGRHESLALHHAQQLGD
jgi:hypothetical protein